MSECDREASIMRRPWPTRGCCAIGGKKEKFLHRLEAFGIDLGGEGAFSCTDGVVKCFT
jgi:hypothetical protein